MFEGLVGFVREIYQTDAFIPLHEPRFGGNEKRYLNDVIDSTFVSSVGPYVGEFERKIAEFSGARHAVATVNGTAALHIALLLAGVRPGDEVVTQAATFVATCNVIAYCGAEPVFIDIEAATLGLAPAALAEFLERGCERRAGVVYNKTSGRRIAACLPMHSFGHPCDMAGLLTVCDGYGIPVVEDAAEALGSRIGERHCGTFGRLGVLSFNGNKIITTGGGGMILTDDDDLARQAKHLTTTAKLAHAWKFEHDQIGYNYRMPNLNAALGLAQLEQLPAFVDSKRALAGRYLDWARANGAEIVQEPAGARSNYWLNALLLDDAAQRDAFLEYSNAHGVMTRPLWTLMPDLPMYRHCRTDGLSQSRRLAERLVNLPSSVAI
ncbi:MULTISPECIES: LegC family aminotransferase [Methylomonas]|uniref:GDP-perosamine synthase n=1 Tax=Methylomonas koyamae TaxID=702114 RepID=A0A177NAW0_9GAMM|nr:LegC family aminotransferase [Methylomonas koyamae]OAI15206.1 aminotransferase DegT [Methylomonas koyamae]